MGGVEVCQGVEKDGWAGGFRVGGRKKILLKSGGTEKQMSKGHGLKRNRGQEHAADGPTGRTKGGKKEVSCTNQARVAELCSTLGSVVAPHN